MFTRDAPRIIVNRVKRQVRGFVESQTFTGRRLALSLFYGCLQSCSTSSTLARGPQAIQPNPSPAPRNVT